ncbi:MAG: SpoIID/LytB domain-containing protein [Candidatus Omnitrophica bacterium]|nr:SpoIID/LytB domain-containing protein [Candidatus Omnitrophota bacterium]
MENSRNRPKTKLIFFLQIAAIVIFLSILPPLVFSGNKSDKIKSCLHTAVTSKQSFQYKKAIETLGNSEEGDSNLIKEYLARFFYLSGQSKRAYQKINELDSKNWDSYLYLGLISEDLGRVNQAISAYEKSLELEKSSIGLFRLGKIYQSRGQFQKAAVFFKKLIDHDSSFRLAYYYLGQSLKKAGKNKNAYKYLAKALNFYPEVEKISDEFKEVKKNIGKEFFLKKREEKAAKREKVALEPYYKQKGIPLVKVGIARGLDRFSFFSPAGFKLQGKNSAYRGKPDFFYDCKLRNKKVVLTSRKTGRVLEVFSPPIELIPETKEGKYFPVYVLDVVYGAGDFWHKKIDRAYRGDFRVVLKKNKITLINIVSLEEYLYGVLAAEIPPSVGKEALSAQAVLARSLAFRNKARHSGEGFDFCADSHCQVYHGFSAETNSTREAVDATRGEVIFYQGKVPEIFYHSNCGGCLSFDIFGKKQYLAKGRDLEKAGMPDSAYGKEEWFRKYPESFCKTESSKFRWQRIYDRQDSQIAFGASLDRIAAIIPKASKSCFRHSKMDLVLTDKTITLETGLAIRNFFDHLRSSAFSLELKKNKSGRPEMLIFWGAGFGHGSGLCQYGAIGMARRGYGYREILKHYYPKARLKKSY